MFCPRQCKSIPLNITEANPPGNGSVPATSTHARELLCIVQFDRLYISRNVEQKEKTYKPGNLLGNPRQLSAICQQNCTVKFKAGTAATPSCMPYKGSLFSCLSRIKKFHKILTQHANSTPTNLPVDLLIRRSHPSGSSAIIRTVFAISSSLTWPKTDSGHRYLDFPPVGPQTIE